MSYFSTVMSWKTKYWRVTLILLVPVVAIIIVGIIISNPIEQTGLPVHGPKDHTLPSFALTNQNGTISGSNELKGKIYVADFFFTHCFSICPKMTTELKRVQDQFAGNDRLKLISISVDPKRDSAARLKIYMKRYEADPAMWTMYTGDKKEIYQLARKGFFITAVEGDGGPQDFIHSEKLVLVDTKRRIRGYYDGTKREEVDSLMAHIKVLLTESF